VRSPASARSLSPLALAKPSSQGATLIEALTENTTMTVYLPLTLKQRIAQAAAAEGRSASQYLVRFLSTSITF
jgi:hypothetical protein